MTAGTVRPCEHCQTDGIGHRDDCPCFPQPVSSLVITEQDLVIALAGKLSAFGDMDSDAAYDLAPVLLSVVYEFADQQAARELDVTAKAMWDPQDKAIVKGRAYRLRRGQR